MSASDFTGAGFIVGGLLGSESNRVAELDSVRERAADFQQANRDLQEQIDELYAAGKNLMGAQVRLKADYEGMRAVITELISAIKTIDQENSFLLERNLDVIAGEASRLSDELNKDSMFSLQMSRRAGMMAVIDACVKELIRLDHNHKLTKTDERFATYWVAYERQIELRKGSLSQAMRWAQKRENTERYMQENSEYFDQVPAAWAKKETAN